MSDAKTSVCQKDMERALEELARQADEQRDLIHKRIAELQAARLRDTCCHSADDLPTVSSSQPERDQIVAVELPVLEMFAQKDAEIRRLTILVDVRC